MSSGGISNLLNIAESGLFAQSQAIRITGQNIANVNTQGYSRRTVELKTRTPINLNDSVLGTGVDVNKIIRQVDQFFVSQYNGRINERAESGIRDEILERVEEVFGLSEASGNIGHELALFFSSLEDLAANPSQIPLRAQVVTQGQLLANAISTTYNTLSGLQREMDNRTQYLVSEVNRLTGEISELNTQIVASEVTNQQNLTLRDQREELLRELSEVISFREVEESNGSINISLDNGFALVTGTGNRILEYTTGPSFEPVGGYPPGLDGSALGFIVYDFDSSSGGESHIDLTTLFAAGGGELGGALKLRGTQSSTDTTPFDASGALVDVASRVEAVARDLLTRFNEVYLGDRDDNGLADDENTGTAAIDPIAGDLDGGGPFPFGLFTFAGAADSDANGRPTAADLTAANVPSFASILEFGINSPREIAAAWDLNAVEGATSFAPGDASNIERLLELRTDPVAYSVGNFSITSTIEEVYSLTVTYVGGLKSTAANDLAIRTEREAQIKELAEQVSGVNLDEEFANLITSQRSFEAAARLIKIGDELLSELVNLI